FPEPSLENDVNVVRIEYHIEFYYQKGIYELNQQRFTTGLESILHCLSLSIPTKRHSISILCAAQFEQYQNNASDPQREKFGNLMKEVLEVEKI
ncbi:hypothetical protein ABNF65_24805, partial [Paenibacillus larvae]